MEKSVLKYPLYPIEDEIKNYIHEGAEYLTIQTQFGRPTLWVLANLENHLVEKWFCIRGTGHRFKGNEGKYLGTFQLDGGGLVFHVFEKLEEGGNAA
jgi:hypothetical protein